MRATFLVQNVGIEQQPHEGMLPEEALPETLLANPALERLGELGVSLAQSLALELVDLVLRPLPIGHK